MENVTCFPSYSCTACVFVRVSVSDTEELLNENHYFVVI